MQKQAMLIYLILTVFTIGLSSCTKETLDIKLQSDKWRVEKLKKSDDTQFIKAENSYFLEFTSDSSFTLRLDANRCEGYYQIDGEGGISVSNLWCTYNCCDTEYALDFVRLIRTVKQYQIKGSKLVLEGQGEIELKK